MISNNLHFPAPGRTRNGPLLTVCLVASMLSIWSIFAIIALETHAATWAGANLLATNLAALLEQGIARDIDLYDLSLESIVTDSTDARIMALSPAVRRRALFDDSANASGLDVMTIVDKDGTVIEQSRGRDLVGTNVSENESFRAQRDGEVAIQPFVGHVSQNAATGHASIAFSRPRLGPGGSFQGVVAGAMTLDFFERLFAAVRLPSRSAVMLMHSDGTILARLPLVPTPHVASAALSQAAAARPSGMLVVASPVDGAERLFAYRRVGRLPIYLAVGLSTAQLFSEWRWRVEWLALAFGALSVIMLCLGAMLARELNRRSRAERALTELATTDSLTRLANRRHFDDALAVEWRRATRETTPVSLLMIDGDHFKGFNDTYGHIEGDRALQRIADVLRAAIARPGDLVARLGGEEFAILLPATDGEGACAVAAAVQTGILDAGILYGEMPRGILTVSIGVATRQPASGRSSAELIQAADIALYAAKAGGRDRTVRDPVAKDRSSKFSGRAASPETGPSVVASGRGGLYGRPRRGCPCSNR